MSNFNEKEGYMCLTDYEWHLEGDELGAIVYPSVKALEAARSCVRDECGIVKVKIQLVEVIKDEDF